MRGVARRRAAEVSGRGRKGIVPRITGTPPVHTHTHTAFGRGMWLRRQRRRRRGRKAEPGPKAAWGAGAYRADTQGGARKHIGRPNRVKKLQGI